MATKEFARLTSLPWQGEERRILSRIVEIYDLFYLALVHLTEAITRRNC